MAIQVVDDEPVPGPPLLVHDLRDAVATIKTVVVVDDDPAGDDPVPEQVQDVLCRLIDVDVDMAERELIQSLKTIGIDLGVDWGKDLDLSSGS